ncbi:MAG TPA: SpoIIE family protein phosphatase [Armatimonadota bacterium]|jgi:sigma-B regulation protein RsbU (phosphoserine phosphatase)|nr:SpoIIE family protein phosphatase [Armatimonadota bacterium]
MKMLVVDDEQDIELLIRQKFRRQIRDGEYEFVFASNGLDALEKLRTEQGIEIILTDINMPVMDGLTLLMKVGELDRVLRAVVVSAYGDLGNIRTAMNRGAFDFLMKPIDFDDLEITIDKTRKQVEQIKEAMQEHSQLEAMHHELDIARTMQQSVLPSTGTLGDRNDIDLHARMIAAREIGGDFYDFFMLDQDRLGFIIADVSGKGIPAALYMMLSRSLVRSRAHRDLSPARCLKEANDVLCVNNATSMFVTLFYGILDLRDGVVRYCNGGHNSPFHLRWDGGVQALEQIGGPMLGAWEGATYTEATFTMKPSESLFLYTDGITEAESAEREFFTTERLETALEKRLNLTPMELVNSMIEAVNAFSAGAQQSDDITAMALRYRP